MATRVPLPMDERNAKLLRLKGAYGCTTQAGSGAPAMWKASFLEPGEGLGMPIVHSIPVSPAKIQNIGYCQCGRTRVRTEREAV